MTQKTIVLVEDDILIRENYADILEDEGYKVRSFRDRKSAYESISQDMPDLAILDIGLGRERQGGMVLCKQLRELSSSLPVIFLTSHDSDADRVTGMHCEIDDYIVKSASIDYLIVRIDMLFKRLKSLGERKEIQDAIIENGDLRLDTNACMAYWKGERLGITLTQYWMLQELTLRPGQAKSASKLMSVANIVVEPNTIAANIKNIRKHFKLIDPEFDKIKAEYGAGYRWIP